MAADSAADDSSAAVRSEMAEKIWQVGDLPVLCGASGNVGVIQDIKDELTKLKIKAQRAATRKQLTGLIRPVQREALGGHVPFPGTTPPNACVLCAGILQDGPFLLEISPTCETTWYHDAEGNFYAIGSGAPWGHSLFRRFLSMDEYDLQTGRLLAYRVVRDAIGIASRSLMGPVHVWELSDDGSGGELSEKDLQRLDQTCDYWLEMEWQSLGRLAGQLTAGEAPPESAPAVVPEPPPPAPSED